MSNKYSVGEISNQLDRLCPSQVDESISGNGQREAGHTANDRKNSIGWVCDGGSTGNLVMIVQDDEIDEIVEKLQSLGDGELDGGGLKESLSEFAIDWHI